MPRTVSVADIEQRVRVATGLVNDDNLSSADFLLLLNACYPEYWDLIAEQGGPGILDKKFTFTTVAGQLDYDLDTVCDDEDFYILTGLFRVTSDGYNIPMDRYQDTQLGSYKPVSQGDITILVHYTPLCPRLTLQTDTVIAYNGWDEALVQRMGVEVRKARDEDPSMFVQGMGREQARIKRYENDRWANATVLERESSDRYDTCLGSDGPDAYILRAHTLELVNRRY